MENGRAQHRPLLKFLLDQGDLGHENIHIAVEVTKTALDAALASAPLVAVETRDRTQFQFLQSYAAAAGLKATYSPIDCSSGTQRRELLFEQSLPERAHVLLNREGMTRLSQQQIIFCGAEIERTISADITIHDGVYKTTDNYSLSYTMFSPPNNTSSKHPVLLLFHGGGWETGSRTQFIGQGRTLAALGLAVFTFDYRTKSVHGTTPFESVEDAKVATAFVHEHADAFGIDRDRIILGGGSAGAHIAAGATLFKDMGDAPDVSALPKAFILFNPVTDTSERGFGHDRIPGDPRALDLTHHLIAGLAPTLVLHGAEDQVVPVANSLEFAETARRKGNECRIYVYPGVGHAFFNYGFNGTSRYFYKTLENVVDFLVDHSFLSQNASTLVRIMNRQDMFEGLADAARGEAEIIRKMEELNEAVNSIDQQLADIVEKGSVDPALDGKRILNNVRAVLPKLNRLNTLVEYIKKP